MDIMIIILGIVIGAGVVAVFLTSKREEPANEDPITQITKNLTSLIRRVEKLEAEKPKFTESQEVRDAIKLVREEQANMREILNDTLTDVNATVLRLIRTFKPNEKKKSEKREKNIEPA